MIIRKHHRIRYNGKTIASVAIHFLGSGNPAKAHEISSISFRGNDGLEVLSVGYIAPEDKTESGADINLSN